MFNKLERYIAFKYLGSKRKEGFISINGIFALIGIILGVATLIIVMSVMNGFRVELMQRIIGINSHVSLIGEGNSIKNYQEKIKILKDLPNIETINPIIIEHAMATNNKYSGATQIRGITAADLKNKILISENIKKGDLKNFTQENAIILGSKLAYKLNARIGDTISIISPNSFHTIAGIIPRIKDYKLVATFAIGMHEYDSSTAFIPLKMAQIHFRYYDTVSNIEIMSNDIKNANNLSHQINLLSIDNNWPVIVHDWQQANLSFINALKVERNVMFLILSLIIIVAAFNIISSIIMLVNDKMLNIALMQTMGMTRASITRIFFICGATIGFIGTVIGAILGTAFAYKINSIKLFLEKLTGSSLFDPVIYFLTDLPSEINPNSIFLIIISSLIICFLAAIYPARKAAKLQPAEIIRHE
jgi:lipoprotein-releasing system permease protein